MNDVAVINYTTNAVLAPRRWRLSTESVREKRS
jgi:hypothetical protein